MMIACNICRTPTQTPEEYCIGDILYCFGCNRRLDIISKQTKATQLMEAPAWTTEQEMELRLSQNYHWKSTDQLLHYMQDMGYFVCFQEDGK